MTETETRRLLRRLCAFNSREMRELMKLAPFRELERGPRLLFEKIAGYMNLETFEAFPSQQSLCEDTGASTRSVRNWTRALESKGALVVRLERRGAKERAYYSVGPAGLEAVHAFTMKARESGKRLQVDLDSLDRIDELERQLEAQQQEVVQAKETADRVVRAVATELEEQFGSWGKAAAGRIRCIAATVAGETECPSTLPEQAATVAHERNSLSRLTEPFYSSNRAHARDEQEKKFDHSEEDESAARSALGELHARKHPTRPPRRVFDAAELATVAACAASVEGSSEEKLRTLLWAIDGAWNVSSGAPCVTFIFGTLEHFEEHVDRGQRRARALERKPHAPPREAVARPLAIGERVELGDALAMLESVGFAVGGGAR